MTTKKPASKNKEHVVAQVAASDDAEKADAMAKLATRPSINAAAVMVSYAGPLGEQDVCALADCLADGAERVWAGDLKRAEAMLYGQAHALQAMFMNFARRANAQEYMKNMEAFTRMALKAQNQCRMTLETLAKIKNPPVVYARQANINNGGQQQVNNSPQPAKQAESAQGGGGIESLPAPDLETAQHPTQKIFPPGAEIQATRTAVGVTCGGS